jgi:hypothetical protein
MTITVTWGSGSGAPTWSLTLPGALQKSLADLARVSGLTPASIKPALRIAEPFLPLAAEALGAGVPELILVVGVVAVAKHMLSQTCPAEPKPAPAILPKRPITTDEAIEQSERRQR